VTGGSGGEKDLKTRILEGLWGGGGGGGQPGSGGGGDGGGSGGECKDKEEAQWIEGQMNRMWRDIKMALP
jgi:hypothetical protein